MVKPYGSGNPERSGTRFGRLELYSRKEHVLLSCFKKKD